MMYLIIYLIIGILFTLSTWFINVSKTSKENNILIYFPICTFLWPIALIMYFNKFIFK